jgi:hypothetical protein
MLKELLICQCVVDGDGNRMYSDEDAWCFDALDGAVSTALYNECSAWTGFNLDTDTKAVEEAIKNSEEASG